MTAPHCGRVALSVGAAASRLRLYLATFLLASALSVLGIVLPLSSASAASEFHAFSTTFGSPGSGAGQLKLTPASINPGGRGFSGVAVNDTTGDVYVGDSKNLRVDQFSAAGSFIRAWGWGVKNGAAEAQTCTEATGCQIGLAGDGAAQFESPDYVVVDNSGGPSEGDVYVGDPAEGAVSKFGPEGALIGTWSAAGRLDGSIATKGPFATILGLAVAPNGDLEVLASNEGGTLFRFSQTGTFVSETPVADNPFPGGFATNPGGNLFDVNGNGNAIEFEPSGTELGRVSHSRLLVTGLALDSGTGDLYAATEGFNGGVEESQVEAYDFNGSGEVIQRSGEACPVVPVPETGCHSSDLLELGAKTETAGVGVNSSSHLVYAADASAQRIVVFRPAPGFALTVAKTGAGEGFISSKPIGIECGSICKAEFAETDTVTLTERPEIGSRFVGWTGCEAEPEGRCEVKINGAESVVATFAPSAGHLFTTAIEGTGVTALSGPTEVAVDQSSHDIYVNDPGHYRVEKFSPSGNFILMFGKEVDHTTGGNVCPEHPGDVCQAGSPGNGPGQFQNPALFAVDNSGGPSDGDLYVADTGDLLVQKFNSNGQIITSWGVNGQKNGSDVFEEGAHKFPSIGGIDVNSAGELYVRAGPYQLYIYEQNGNPQRKAAAQVSGNTGPPDFKLNPLGFDATDSFFQLIESHSRGGFGDNKFSIQENSDSGDPERSATIGTVTSIVSTTGFAFDPNNGSLYQDVTADKAEPEEEETPLHGPGVERYEPTCEPKSGPCTPIESFGAGHLSGNAGISIDGSNSTVYVANSEANDIAVFADARPGVTTGPPTALDLTSATLSGTIDPETHGSNHGPITECRLEYGFTNAYGHTVPCEPDPAAAHFTSTTAVTATVNGLTPLAELPNGTEYHYRFVASNESGATGLGQDRIFKTTAPPRIEGLSTSHVTATSAVLEASVDPHGLATSYTFEYGTTPEYGTKVTGKITGSLLELSEPRSIEAQIDGLESGVTYHFRLVAENADDEGDPVVSEDQDFEFFPAACPNSAVRQQTGAAYLPDCRGYELVSPSNANGTLFYPGGPNTGQATSPSRFAYTGAFSAPPGVNPINTAGDLYVATRTSTGWVSSYIGLPGNQAGCMGGPPNDGRDQQAEDPRRITNGVLTNPSMSSFLDYIDGNAISCVSGGVLEDQDSAAASASMAPFEWSAEGTLERRLPTPAGTSQAALKALECPLEGTRNEGNCTGETTASGDLSHIVFSSASVSFSEPGEPNGLTTAPGSAYEENLATGKITLISRLPAALGGGSIPQDPTFATTLRDPPTGSNFDMIYGGGKEEYIRFPAVSTDGSHVLMSTATIGQPEECKAFAQSYDCERDIEDPLHLYMHIGGEGPGETYEVAEDPSTHQPAVVTYVGMTPSGSDVFFTSEEHLTHEDEEHGGASLFMWSAQKAEEGKPPLTLISKGPSEAPGEPGNIASCNPALAPFRANHRTEEHGHVEEGSRRSGVVEPWTKGCGVVPYSGYRYSFLDGGLGGSGYEGRTGGSGFTPAGITENGDIYFFSPEKLDGIHGTTNQENLFLYRNGHLQYVTTLVPERRCGPHTQGDEIHCSDGPVVRLQTTPDDSHMAFITASQVTPYDNAGHLEMYSYTPASGEIHCDSCNPDGQPATADVFGSEDGLFLTDDGRTFFSTTESLVPRDTNEGEDVYEYVDGRPQLITTGTGTAELGATGITGSEGHTETDPGLVGVSADGTDVYFSTLDTLISEDHNGNYLKFYDARTNGGFPQPPPVQPCAAAEECHGPGTEAPQLPAQGTAAALSGGNVTHRVKHHHKKKHHHKSKKSQVKHKKHQHRTRTDKRHRGGKK